MVVDLILKKTRILALLAALLITFSNHANAEQSCPVARGGAMLAALKPGFPINQTVDMLSAAAPHPAIAVVHKSFGSNYLQLRAIINSLLNHPKRPSTCVSVIVYVECGPCRAPRRPAGLFPVIAPSLTIQSLNSRLERAHIPTLKAFGKAIKTIQTELPELPGVRYILEPGLEDNFSEAASNVILSLIKQEYGNRKDYTLGRNRIDNRSITRPLIKEIHTYDVKQLSGLRPGDIITGDGYILCLPTDKNCRGYSFSQVAHLMDEANKRGIIVLLWRPEWQGLKLSPSVQLIPPSKRKYSLVGRNYIKQLLDRK